jgi:hypothetical protein
LSCAGILARDDALKASFAIPKLHNQVDLRRQLHDVLTLIRAFIPPYVPSPQWPWISLFDDGDTLYRMRGRGHDIGDLRVGAFYVTITMLSHTYDGVYAEKAIVIARETFEYFQVCSGSVLSP